MTAVGFDFGTTNSLISLVQGNRVISFLDEQGLPIPSVVCYEGSKTIVGREAKERLGESGLGVHGNVIRSPKALLGRESVFVSGVERNPIDVVRDVVTYVRTQAQASRSIKGLEINKAVVTIPVNMHGDRRAALREAFRLAGVGIVQFIHEPLAALYAYLRSSNDYAALLRRFDRQLLLVFDWGGGTLDLTLCRLIDGKLFQVINDGTDEVGGDIFDDALKNEVEKRVRLRRNIEEDITVQPQASTRLLHRCERAKIELSQRSTTELFVSDFFRHIEDTDLHHSLSRDELEQIIAPLLDKGLSRIERLLDNAGYSPASVALCLATGGMANMPAIRSRLHEIFGPQRVQISEHSASLISEGAAWVAHDNVNLQLARNVELLLARNSFVPLIKAGFEMPREGEVKTENFGMYCADPRDGFAKFQLYAAAKIGNKVFANDARLPLENLMVRVDANARPLRERLELELQIDDNLILHAKGRSLEKKDFAEVEIHSLEFALSLPASLSIDPTQNDSEDGTELAFSKERVENRLSQKHQKQSQQMIVNKSKGDIIMRSNVIDKPDDYFVPGELLYKFNRVYFDSRQSPPPPQIQVEEKLYYEPCIGCGRSSSDPLCKC